MKSSRIILIVSGVLLTANAAAATFAINMHTGLILAYFLGTVLLVSGIFYDAVRVHIPKVIRYLFSAGALTAAILLCAVFIYGSVSTVTYSEDAVIVLGSGIRGDQLPDNLKNRLDTAVGYYSQNTDALIVVSGGHGPGETVSESLAMKRYLLSHGVPEDKIIEENRATSTVENFLFSKEILDEIFDGQYSTAFITNDYHIFRADFSAETAGFESITHLRADTPWYLIVPNGLREIPAVIVQWLLT